MMRRMITRCRRSATSITAASSSSRRYSAASTTITGGSSPVSASCRVFSTCWVSLSDSGDSTDSTTWPPPGASRRPLTSAAKWSSTTRPLITLGGGSARRLRSTSPSRANSTITLSLASRVIARQPTVWRITGLRGRRPTGGETDLARLAARARVRRHPRDLPGGGFGERQAEVTVLIGPEPHHPHAGGGQLGLDPLAAELGRDLGAHFLPRGKRDHQVEIVDRDLLRTLGAQPHLDPLVLGVPERDVPEFIHVEVRVEFPVDHHEHVAVERGGHPGRVVVGAQQPADVLHQVGAQQERVPRTQRRADLCQEAGAYPGLEVADGGAYERDSPPPPGRNGPDVVLKITDERRDRQPGELGGERVAGLGEHGRVDVERDELAQGPAVQQRAQQQPGLGRRATAQLDQGLAP